MLKKTRLVAKEDAICCLGRSVLLSKKTRLVAKEDAICCLGRSVLLSKKTHLVMVVSHYSV